jgi:GNAT superfamily N-acetyltransferase
MRDPSADLGVGNGGSEEPPRYWIDRLDTDADLDGVLEVESESFTNPWTREMYTWELQNRAVCHIFVARLRDCAVAGFCAFWLVLDEIHINNVAVRPQFRGVGIGSALLRHALAEARQLGARRATKSVPRTTRRAACTSASVSTSLPRVATTTRNLLRTRSSCGGMSQSKVLAGLGLRQPSLGIEAGCAGVLPCA